MRIYQGIAKDYEFVPRVRTVMIIDDDASDSDSDSGPGSHDDGVEAFDWEVIPGLGERRERHARATYATVARTGN